MPVQQRLKIDWPATTDPLVVDIDSGEAISVEDLKHKLRTLIGVPPDRLRIVRRSAAGGQARRAILTDADSVTASDDLALEYQLPGGCDVGCGTPGGERCNVCCNVQ